MSTTDVNWSASPLVSVVIPTFNQPQLMAETLDSVLAQTLTDFEVIVVDDGSTDHTPQRLAEYAARDQRIRVVRQANAGIGAARNRGLDEARGKYVALLDHDDLWMPEKLATQVRYLQDHPDCAACSVLYSYSTTPNRCVYDASAVKDADGIVQRPLKTLSAGHVFLISSSILVDRARAVGLRYAEVRGAIEDVPFQVGLFARGKFGIAGDRILMVYRWHEQNFSSQAVFFSEGIRLLRRLMKRGQFDDLRGQDRGDLLHYFAHIGRTASMRQLLSGNRLKAWAVYLREFGHQVADKRLKFLASFPALSILPTKIIRRRWGPPPASAE